MLEKIAYYQQENNSDKVNIELALALCAAGDNEAIREIYEGLFHPNPAIAGDCIKVLYEIGRRRPALISDYVAGFIDLLSSKNNRLVWGSMCALAAITPLKSDYLYRNLDRILAAYRNGTVITVDHAVSVLAELCKADPRYSTKIFPLLIEHLETCRLKEIPQHAERIAIAVNPAQLASFSETVKKREALLSNSQRQRLNKLLKSLEAPTT